MKKLLYVVGAILAATFIYSTSLGQAAVGFYYDADGTPIDGYIDQLDYSPKNSLSIIFNSDGYEKGSYYDAEGKKHDGFIKFENKKIWFKKQNPRLESKRLKLKPTEVKQVIVGVDSFFATTNFDVEQKVGPTFRTAPEFMQYLTSFNGLTFAKHYNFSSGLGQAAYASPIIETYQVKKGNGNWVSFPRTKTRFKRVALAIFGHIPYLKEGIEAGTFSFDDMMYLIKTAEYIYKSEQGESIYFDAYWQELSASQDYTYKATIKATKEDSLFSVVYANKAGLTLYKASYSSVYPHRKVGDFIAYYPNGKVRKVATYKANKLAVVKTFFENGTLHRHYKIAVRKAYINGVTTDRTFIKLLSSKTKDGKSSFNDGVEQLNDEANKRTVVNTYGTTAMLKNSYVVENGQKNYQFVNFDRNFNVNPIQKKLSMHFAETDFFEAVKANAQGILLIRFKVNEKGQCLDYAILNKLHPEIDIKVKRFLKWHFGQDAYVKHKLKKEKLAGEKQGYEIVVPLYFGINRFYRMSNTWCYDWNHHWMMHNQMWQQNFINSIPQPTFPR